MPTDTALPAGARPFPLMTLGPDRSVTSGSAAELAAAIRRGADLRIYTEFRHNEHIDTSSDDSDLVQEVAEFRVTYLLGDRWVAGIMTLRQPVDLPHGFGPRPSMSFFLYNQNGDQAIARPYLDGPPVMGVRGASPRSDHTNMPKYHQADSWDGETNAPSSNFVYDFDVYRFWVRDEWREVLAHAPDGSVESGSVRDLAFAFASGAEVKVGIRALCDDLAGGDGPAIDHEVFVQVGSGYHYT